MPLVKRKRITTAKLKKLFVYKNGNLYWKCGPYNRHKVGWKRATEPRYLIASIGGKYFYVHRLIFQFHRGFCPAYIDHKNGKVQDNRISNLRESCPKKNAWNKKIPKNNTSGCKGVSLERPTGKWRVYFQKDKKRVYLGTFKSKTLAIKVYKKHAKRVLKHFYRRSDCI